MKEHKQNRKNLANPITATLAGAADLLKKRQRIGALKDSERIDGKTVLITGANSGLGFATSVDLAKRGGHVIMACRSGIPNAGEKVRQQSGSNTVEMMKVDMSDLHAINNLCDELKSKGKTIDILILNAAVVPAHSRKTKQGLEEMFMVNYFSSFILVNRILQMQLLAKASDGNYPRIIFTASESHRGSPDIDWENFGKYNEFTMGKAVAYYGYYKLMLTTFAQELGRRLNNVMVFSLCPGAVNTNIAKEAPASLKPIVKVFFKMFFSDPFKADEPIVYFACSTNKNLKSSQYLHLMAEKEVDERASNPENGRMLWEKSEDLMKSLCERSVA